jgi:hypothetical protein
MNDVEEIHYLDSLSLDSLGGSGSNYPACSLFVHHHLSSQLCHNLRECKATRIQFFYPVIL